MTTKSTLYVFAGPNESGKSTLFNELNSLLFQSKLEQVNGDVIYKQSPYLTQAELAVVVAERVKGHFKNHNSFSIETNLATSASYNVLTSAHRKGYRISLFYVCLESAQLCRKRVKDRVSKGGHDVPFAIIEQRYKNALSLIEQHYLLFDDIDFIDNSAGSFTSVGRVETGKLTCQAEKLPAWAAGIVDHIRMMEKAIRKTNAD